jgi:hypothetical protein
MIEQEHKETITILKTMMDCEYKNDTLVLLTGNLCIWVLSGLTKQGKDTTKINEVWEDFIDTMERHNAGIDVTDEIKELGRRLTMITIDEDLLDYELIAKSKVSEEERKRQMV